MSNKFVPPRRAATVVAFSALVSVYRWAILAVVLLLLAPYALAYVENPRAYPATDLVLRYHDRLVQLAVPQLRQYVPTTIAGKDRADWIMIGGLVIVAIGAGSLRDRLVVRATARQVARHIQLWKESMQLGADSQASIALDERFKALKSAKGVGRAELLRAFAEAKKNLDALGREVAFLSIDVVGSTAMKEHEERAAVQYDFVQYRKLVEAVFQERGVLKSTWTPDGVTNRLLVLVEQGVIEPEDDNLKQRLAGLQLQKAELEREIVRLQEGALTGPPTLTPERLAALSVAMRQRLAEGPPELRQAYMRLLLDAVLVGAHEIRLAGPPAALERLAPGKGCTTKCPCLSGTYGLPAMVGAPGLEPGTR